MGAVMNVFIPGLGHMYHGYIGRGLAWMFGLLFIVAVCAELPIIIVLVYIPLWITCIVKAAKMDKAWRISKTGGQS